MTEVTDEKLSARSPLAVRKLPPMPRIRTADGRYMDYQNTLRSDWIYDVHIDPSNRFYIIGCAVVLVLVAIALATQVFTPVFERFFLGPRRVTTTPRGRPTMPQEPASVARRYNKDDDFFDDSMTTPQESSTLTSPQESPTVTPPQESPTLIYQQVSSTLTSPQESSILTSSQESSILTSSQESSTLTPPQDLDSTTPNITMTASYRIPGDSFDKSTTTTANVTGHPSRTTPVVHKSPPKFKVGVGIADMTGPPAQVAFMGHMDAKQIGTGIHTRQFSRAFCFLQGDKRLVFVVAEIFAVGYGLRSRVLRAIRKGKERDYSIYNVHVAATGTHNTPGSHIAEYMFGVGPPYCEQCMRAYVQGIVKSIKAACKAPKPSHLVVSYGEVHDSQINRSLKGYLRNPLAERQRYEVPYDRFITQLRVEDKHGRIIGLVNWFALHASSISPTNYTLVSSDNFGYVSLRMEKYFAPEKLAGRGTIVVAFAPSNHGDVSPNVNNGTCLTDSKTVCWGFGDCKENSRCLARGPTSDAYRNAEIIGNRLYDGAMRALKGEGTELTGSLEASYRLLNDRDSSKRAYDPIKRRFVKMFVSFCPPRLLDRFNEGHYDDSLEFSTIEKLKAVAVKVLPPYASCYIKRPAFKGKGKGTVMHPKFVTLSVLNLGGLLVACLPGEPSTMAGRRIRDVMKTTLMGYNMKPLVVISGQVNEFILSIITPSEHRELGNPEARFNVYGVSSLSIITRLLVQATKQALKVTSAMRYSEGLGEEDQYHTKTDHKLKELTILPPKNGTLFQIHSQPDFNVTVGSVARAELVGTNPRCNNRHGSTYMQVERRIGPAKWLVIARDAEWETRFTWNSVTYLTTLEWHVPEDTQLGDYRMRVFGGTCISLKQIMTVSRVFRVVEVAAESERVEEEIEGDAET